MAKFKARFRDPNGKTLYLQKRVWTLFNFVPLMIGNLFSKEDWGVRDVSDLSNRIYEIDEELNYLAEEAKELMRERKEQADWIKSEKSRMSKDTYATRGFSDFFTADSSDFGKFGFFKNPPKQDWKAVFHPKLTGEARTTLGRDRIEENSSKGNNKPGKHGTRTAFTPPGFEHRKEQYEMLAEDLDAQHHVQWKEESKGKGGGGGLQSRKKLKDRDETDASHQARLKLLNSGQAVPDSWDLNQ